MANGTKMGFVKEEELKYGKTEANTLAIGKMIKLIAKAA